MRTHRAAPLLRRAASVLTVGGAAAAALPLQAQRLSPTLPVEVFAGRVEFDPDLGLRDQELLGVRLGVDLATYAGVRGFYWRGIDADRSGAAAIQAYGGEAQLNLNAGNGVTPFLLGGAGRLDFLEGYESLQGALPNDRTFGIVGAGLRVDLWRVGLSLAARSYLFNTDSLDRTDTEDLQSNVALTAGVSFRLGRRGTPPVPRGGRVTAIRGDTVYVTQVDTFREGRAYDAERMVTIPIPREGELYVRYGPVDSLSLLRRSAGDTSLAARAGRPVDEAAVTRRVLAELEPRIRDLLAQDRAEVREIVRAEVARAGAGGLSAADEARLLDNLERRLALRLPEGEAGGRTVVVAPGVAGPVEVREEEAGFRPRLREVRPYLGGNLDRPRQFVAGLKLDLGPLNPRRPSLRVVPEAALGLGEANHSLLLAANLQYEFRDLRVAGVPFQPHVYAGPGILFMGDPPRGRAGTEAVLDVGYGISARLPHRGARRRFFIEHQGVDLFDLNRVIVGLRW
ncbi:MAG TPA: hypothetical protein VHG91_07145 [Longimicrobium sp.]|nr:hypothetical protein [Longimicrobium sp.]